MDPACYRYVQILEQQHGWLVHGIQELYRHTINGNGWPGEPLKTEPNGHPLIHDLLTQLGALNQSKGEHFKENLEAMQQDLWRQNTRYMQYQESADGSSESTNFTIMTSKFADDFACYQLPPTLPNYSSSARIEPLSTKVGLQMSVNSHAYSAVLSLPGVVDPTALQWSQKWPQSSFSPFDEIDLMGSADYTSLSFDELQDTASPLFIRQTVMNCMPSTTFLQPKR
jgi:hypothetical protein